MLLSKIVPLQWQSGYSLWQEAVSGNVRAAQVLVDQLTPKAHALAWRMLGDRHEAEDVVQDALIKLLRTKSFEGRSSLGTYFHTIVSRLCLDRLRATQPDEFHEEGWSDFANEDQPLSSLSGKQSALELQKAITQLKPRQRLAILLWTYQDAGADEIARVMDLEVNAAHQLLHRAKQNLKKLLGERDEG